MFRTCFYVFLFFLFNFIQWMMWFRAAAHLFPSKCSLACTLFAESVSTLVAGYLDAYPLADYMVLRSLSFFVFFVLPVLLLHRGKLLQKIIFSVLILGSMVLTELIMSLIAPQGELRIALRDYYSLDIIFFYAEYLCCQALSVFAVVLVFRALEKKANDYISSTEQVLFLLFPISQYILLTGWYLNYVSDLSVDELLSALVVLVFCVITDVLLFRLILRLSDHAQLRARNKLMEQQIAAKNEYYQIMAQTFSDMSRLRHDIANHLYTIQVLLEDEKRSEALQYAEELRQNHTVKTVLSDCENMVIDSFMRSRIDSLAANNIPVQADIRLPSHSTISDVDMIIAFGNLLDNAVESCVGVDNPYIHIRAVLSDGFLHIEMENPCCINSGRQEKRRRIPYLDRGIGSTILQSLADKYCGSYTVSVNDHTFHATLVLGETPVC